MIKKAILLALVILSGLAAYYWIDWGPPPRETAFKVILLGFDGVDPDLIRRWIEDLPNVKKLSEVGTFDELGTTNPPESPVAWASFATGTNPGKHGIFDFLRRDEKNYLPDIGLAKVEKPKFLFGAIPYQGSKITNYRQGVPFWKHLDQGGISSVNLRMPVEMPVTKLRHGRTLAGLGVPDIGRTWGTFFYFGTDLTAWDLSENASTEFGGRQVLLEMDEALDNKFRALVTGPPDPRKEPKPGDSNRLEIPLEVERSQDSSAVTIRLGGREETVKEGHWSDWFRFEFDIGPFVSASGISRFYVLETYPEVRLYLMPISLNPSNPPVPITYPANYSKRQVEQHGRFKTLGWIHETMGLNEEQIDEGVFLEDLFRNMNNLEKMLLAEIDKGGASLYTAVFTATDSVSHMFYRLIDEEHPRYEARLAEKYGDAILRVYKRMDSIIGEVLARLDPQDHLMVVSDHGFHTWRKEFNTNTWLVRNGYMILKGMDSDPTLKKLDHMFSGGSFFPNVDWGRTRAYSLGLGHVYINLKGRESKGIVEPGQEYDDLVKEIRERIVEYRDPDNGEKALVNAYYYKDIYHGDNMSHAGDIQLSFATGYRTSWQTALGAVPANILTANLKKWSGDHCASDVDQTSGFFLSKQAIVEIDPNIIDIAPTLYRLFDVEIPQQVDGRPLHFAASAATGD